MGYGVFEKQFNRFEVLLSKNVTQIKILVSVKMANQKFLESSYFP
jgi:hypothetical protein